MPTHDIIDNRTEKLVDHIRQALPGSQAAKFAVGYFFLSGLEAVADVLENVRELRLLTGNTSSRETVEQIAEGYRRLVRVYTRGRLHAKAYIFDYGPIYDAGGAAFGPAGRRRPAADRVQRGVNR